MRVIVIDPNTGSIAEGDKPESVRTSAIVGGLPVVAFAIRHPGQHDFCYVDNEGLLKYDRYFAYALGHQPYYAGVGVVEGVSLRGDCVPAKTELVMLKSLITFFD